MRKVTGYISVRPLGTYDFEFFFFVEDDATEQEIRQKIDDIIELSQDYDVEDGYEAVIEIISKKKN